MDLKIALMIMALAYASPPSAFSRNDISQRPSQKYEAIAPSLDERFQSCISNDSCTIKERVNLLNDLNKNMRKILLRMEQACTINNDNSCSLPKNEKAIWQERYDQTGRIMQSLITAENNSPAEPSAAANDKRRF